MAPKRLAYADMVKGIAILFVVLYHLLAPCLAKTVVIHLAESMMIAFFFFSGYFYRPGRRTLGENIKTRLKATMLPFVKYSTVFWIIGSIYLLVTHQETILDALCCLRNFYAGCIWNRVIQGWFNWDYHSLGSRYIFLADFWFLIALFLSSLLFFPIADATLSSRKKAIGAAALLFATTGILRAFAVSLPYNIQLVPFWTAFMLLGALAGKEGLFDLPLMSGTRGWCCALLALAAGVTVAMLKTPVPNLFRGSFEGNEVVSMLLCIIATLLMVWGLGNVCRLAEQAEWRIKELSWLGAHSLPIYVFHMFNAWAICTITGFSLKYEASASGGVLVKSVLLSAACLELSLLSHVVGEKIASDRRKPEGRDDGHEHRGSPR